MKESEKYMNNQERNYKEINDLSNEAWKVGVEKLTKIDLEVMKYRILVDISISLAAIADAIQLKEAQ